MKTIENKLEICPFIDECATEYGDADVCKEEGNYEECIIYKRVNECEEKK